MIIERVSLYAPAGRRDELCKTITTILAPTQVEHGCVSFRLCQSWLDEDTIIVESRWNSKDDLVRHLRSETYKKLLLVMELGTRAPVIEFFTVSEIRGMELIESARGCAI